MKIQK